MPYIKKDKRKMIDGIVKQLADTIITLGDVNYVITKLLHIIIDRDAKQTRFRYASVNSIIGVLECVKLEFYRMVIAPYENKKRMENGPISDLDAKTLEDVR
ncbi:hypothetical protein LCGC14_0487030 [marine sediment metagenome]|uniref:Uncharacterized protein n=1 Tax=marine sediment metagenome TaxID=412755 RepID=A0A0F9SCX5_9ZZZZ